MLGDRTLSVSPRWHPWWIVFTVRLSGAYVPLLIFALWWIAARDHLMSAQILPSPGGVWLTALELGRGEIWQNIAVSLLRLGLGLLAGISFGALLGACLGASSRLQNLVLPTFSALAQIPTLAWIPLFMVFFGIGELLKLMVLIKAVVVPITLHTLVGVRDAQPGLREAAAVLRLPKLMLIRRLIIPAAMPSFMAGVRLALSAGWSSLLAVELLASSEGIGYLMVWARQLFMLDIVFVCIAVIGLIGVVLDLLIGWVDQKTVHWPHPPTSRLKRFHRPGGRQSLTALYLPLTLLVLWQTAYQLHWVDREILVSPLRVLGTLFAGMLDASLLHAISSSLTRALMGLLIGGFFGLAAGLLLGLSRPAERLFGPSLGALRQIAIFAWVPLLTAWFGLGESAKWVFVSFAAFFPLYIATHRSVASQSEQLNEVALVLGLNLQQRLRKFVLPGAAPGICSGLRLSLIYSWLGAIGSEYFMPSNGGIGSLMIGAQQLMDMDKIMAAMLLVGITGGMINHLGHRIEARVTRWRQA
ncbi:ABC transporter permease [Pseudomonas sp. S37]|uniref:ABC transporter permease n=1 Tax=unclassified Pseudomonas TaxID=196821 RepID=UPI0019115F1D|nr:MULTISPECIES: ABC transporter permease [unclassified Pseudomonas]MBK4987618.1 ABC transporter permease [Pseudomonas sp. S36]MBK4991935.1 ABC transporter permease [Pseudomonas sp. S37]MBK5006911.1 ABC transporter permease [Pseudomonas sp. S32]MBK5012805.1 ABC transporter permease [Pseudomonas sp. S60]